MKRSRRRSREPEPDERGGLIVGVPEEADGTRDLVRDLDAEDAFVRNGSATPRSAVCGRCGRFHYAPRSFSSPATVEDFLRGLTARQRKAAVRHDDKDDQWVVVVGFGRGRYVVGCDCGVLAALGTALWESRRAVAEYYRQRMRTAKSGLQWQDVIDAEAIADAAGEFNRQEEPRRVPRPKPGPDRYIDIHEED